MSTLEIFFHSTVAGRAIEVDGGKKKSLGVRSGDTLSLEPETVLVVRPPASEGRLGSKIDIYLGPRGGVSDMEVPDNLVEIEYQRCRGGRLDNFSVTLREQDVPERGVNISSGETSFTLRPVVNEKGRE